MIEFIEASIEVEDPTVPDRARQILAPVSTTLTESRITVIGANGSGKSSLIRLINGLLRPTSGRVLVNGLDTRSDGPAIRRAVGFVFTDPTAQLVMPTPVEDIALSLRRTVQGSRARTARALEILDSYGLADRAQMSVHDLSGGQKQLLALAGVLAAEPTILVCDEPTTLLDLRWRAHVNNVLAGLPQQVVTVTHDLQAAGLAGRVLVLDEGRIVFDGPGQESVEFYRRLMSEQPHPGTRSGSSSGYDDSRSGVIPR